MVQRINWLLLLHTILVMLIMQVIGALGEFNYITYIALSLIIYLVSFIYFRFAIRLFEEKKKKKPKAKKKLTVKETAERKRIASILYKSYFLIGQLTILVKLFEDLNSWNKETLKDLGIAYLVFIPSMIVLVKITMLIIIREREKK